MIDRFAAVAVQDVSDLLSPLRPLVPTLLNPLVIFGFNPQPDPPGAVLAATAKRF